MEVLIATLDGREITIWAPYQARIKLSARSSLLVTSQAPMKLKVLRLTGSNGLQAARAVTSAREEAARALLRARGELRRRTMRRFCPRWDEICWHVLAHETLRGREIIKSMNLRKWTKSDVKCIRVSFFRLFCLVLGRGGEVQGCVRNVSGGSQCAECIWLEVTTDYSVGLRRG